MGFDFSKYEQAAEPEAISAMPLSECLAKTRINSAGEKLAGCTVLAHSLATSLVFRELIKVYEGTARHVLLPPEGEWLCALHDLGKLTPGFQQKIYAAIKIRKDFGSRSSFGKENHALSSQLFLRGQFGEQFARLAGAHHGTGFLSTQFHSESDFGMGGPAWKELRVEFVRQLEKLLPMPPPKNFSVDEETMPVLLGALILADWLSSSMDIAYGDCPDEALLAETVRLSGFAPFRLVKNLSFRDIFPFAPNCLQVALQAKVCAGGTYIVEAEMGGGKTEAALFLAYKLLENKQANGIYFALPTQLTSEKIHQRVDAFLDKILAEDEARSALLIHGQSWLNWDLVQDSEDGLALQEPGSWFYAPKRAILAPFAVGTIDQALMALINVKHRDLRAFGLAGKVVIIDEVHSYDSYTGTLIAELVKRLRDWSCTVIILSATLSKDSRGKLLSPGPEAEGADSAGYPLLSIQESEGGICSSVLPPGQEKQVELINTVEPEFCLHAAMQAAMQGQQVLWIENTIAKTQELLQKIMPAASVQNIEVGLIHSRFPVIVRDINEEKWTEIYGKQGGDKRALCGRILIGTQVLEQSLDIDADLLITRLAPSDMLLQRIGRLWRHASLPRCPQARCRAIILHEEKYDTDSDLFYHRKADLPYERYVMVRSQEIFWQRKTLAIPADIRSIIEATYSERQETDSMLRLKADLAERIRKMQQRAMSSSSAAINVVDDELALTRLNDLPQVQLLLLRKNNRGDSLSEKLWSPFLEEPILLPSVHCAPREKKRALKKLYSVLIKTNCRHAPSYESFDLEEALGGLMYLGDSENRPLRAAYLDDSDYLLDKSGNYAGTTGARLRYNSSLGLQTIKETT